MARISTRITDLLGNVKDEIAKMRDLDECVAGFHETIARLGGYGAAS